MTRAAVLACSLAAAALLSFRPIYEPDLWWHLAQGRENAAGHLVNGAFSLPQALQAKGSSVSATGGAYAPVGGSASPTTLLTYVGPVSNDGVTLNFKQPIASTDPLRTGTYGKALTFTLSTTTP